MERIMAENTQYPGASNDSTLHHASMHSPPLQYQTRQLGFNLSQSITAVSVIGAFSHNLRRRIARIHLYTLHRLDNIRLGHLLVQHNIPCTEVIESTW